MISLSFSVPRLTASPQGEAFWSVFLLNVLENKKYQEKKASGVKPYSRMQAIMIVFAVHTVLFLNA